MGLAVGEGVAVAVVGETVGVAVVGETDGVDVPEGGSGDGATQFVWLPGAMAMPRYPESEVALRTLTKLPKLALPAESMTATDHSCVAVSVPERANSRT